MEMKRRLRCAGPRTGAVGDGDDTAQERRHRERLLAQTSMVRNQKLFSAAASNGRNGEERTDESPVEGEAGGGGRGGEIEDEVHSRASARWLCAPLRMKCSAWRLVQVSTSKSFFKRRKAWMTANASTVFVSKILS